MKQYKFHPYADLFPLMEGDEFDELVADIKANGLRDLIITTENGLILDGRNRYRACLVAKVDAQFGTREDDGKLLEFVISKNMRRRHLTTSQRSMIAAKLSEMGKGQICPNAEMLKVSERQVKVARRIRKTGAKSLIKAVEKGDVSVTAAAKVAELPKAQQRKLVEKGPEAIAAAATPEGVTGGVPYLIGAGAQNFKVGTSEALGQNWTAAPQADRDQFLDKHGLVEVGTMKAALRCLQFLAPEDREKFRNIINSQPPSPKVETAKPTAGADQFGRVRPAPGTMLKTNGATGKHGAPPR